MRRLLVRRLLVALAFLAVVVRPELLRGASPAAGNRALPAAAHAGLAWQNPGCGSGSQVPRARRWLPAASRCRSASGASSRIVNRRAFEETKWA